MSLLVARRPGPEQQFFDGHLLNGLADCCLALAGIFALMLLRYLWILPAEVKVVLCTQKFLWLVGYLGLSRAIRARHFKPSQAQPLSYITLLSVVLSVLLTVSLAPGEDSSLFLELLLIALSLVQLHFRDGLAQIGLVFVAWLGAEWMAPGPFFSTRLATMILFGLVSCIALVHRIRVFRKLYWLRLRDEASNQRLRRSLEESEQMRQNLDALVVERTAQLWQAHKMESLGRLAGGVAHDFNNLLTIILTNLEMAQEGSLDEDQRESLQDAQTASLRAAELTAQLLAYSRCQVIEMEQINLVEFFTQMRRLVQPLIGSTINTHWHVEPERALVLAESGRLQQVLLNLVANARDSMPSGGNLNFYLDSRDGGYQMTVVDEGCGIPSEDLHRVMDPFYTTKPVGKGTGLGLSIVFGVVEQFSGRVQIDSRPGQGTRVGVWLPELSSTATN
ncbi:MAG: ATP-binding protein [Vulcanimicrobiota bacterium]